MICPKLSDLIGFCCHPLTDDGSVALIATPFTFTDGDEIPVFVEKTSDQVRFFDDGGVILHLMGRGVTMDDHRNTRFLKAIAEPNGVALNRMGELEIIACTEEAPQAFSKYISTMLAITAWEKDQSGSHTDASIFLDEVAMLLRAWKSSDSLSEGREYRGVTGHVYKLDFQFEGGGVLAIGIHPSTVSTAAKKLLDIRAATDYKDEKILVIIDDRSDAATAKQEGLIFDSLGNVMMMSRLEKNAGRTSAYS